jgi:hypothetical protein
MYDDPPTAAIPQREHGGADHDEEYRFGQPKLLLSAHELARLLILRGRVLDGELR